MDVIFRIFSITFQNTTVTWWKDKVYFHRLFRILDEVGLWEELNYYGIEGAKKIESIQSLEALLEKTKTWKENPYLLRSQKEDQGVFVGITLRKRGINFYVRLNGDALDKRREYILEVFVDLGCRLHEEFKQEALFGPDFEVSILNSDYPRPRPPYAHPLWPVGNVVDFVSIPFREKHPGDIPDSLQKLLNSQVPEGVIRLDLGDLIVFRWIDNLLDEAHVAASRTMQEQWFSRVLNYPIQPSFNTFGDYLETPWELTTHPPLTFYDSQFKDGYKALVLNPDGQLDPATLLEITGWLDKKILPDGAVLDNLNVIFPDRKSAVTFEEKAKEIGIQKVLYTNSDGSLWNINPPGLWLDAV